MNPKESKESRGIEGKAKESIEEQIERMLEKRVPWNVIARELHVSTKTINDVKNKGISKVNSEGDVAARAYSLFERGVGPIGAVIELKQPPEIVERLYAKWLEQKGLVVLPRNVMEATYTTVMTNTNFVAIDAVTLRKAIEYLVVRHRTLAQFTYPGAYCRKLIEASPDVEWKWLVQSGYMLRWDHPECNEAYAQRQRQLMLEEERKRQSQRQSFGW